MSCEVFNESDFGMIEGSQQTLNIDLYNIFGEEYKNILISEVCWKMSVYGETECVLAKNSSSNSTDIQWNNNTILITILDNDTLGFHGKFTHQAIIKDLYGNSFSVDLGKISIKPQIKIN